MWVWGWVCLSGFVSLNFNFVVGVWSRLFIDRCSVLYCSFRKFVVEESRVGDGEEEGGVGDWRELRVGKGVILVGYDDGGVIDVIGLWLFLGFFGFCCYGSVSCFGWIWLF